MGKIIISTNCSLDGVVQDPDGKDGSARGGWFDQSMGTDRTEWVQDLTAEALHAEALLLGRKSDEWFASRWLSRTGEWADKLNSMPKYIVSSTLEHPAWSNATLLKGDPVAQATKLKRDLNGEILVYGSFQLAHTLMQHDLVDEVRLMVMPIVVGEGTRLFSETTRIRPLRLRSTKPLGNGIIFSDYEVVREA
jgi:dihydrofolate reductase